ncbi:uncharacterized protein LOC108143190 [Drosophila elegans]|uniref:uncharacterized protein LOC108143190 n=1 Tax=Drosophila elegans TaxID=30023 RepID=UPI0007E743C0|nr:uncharacterized protein LOC108143190 [Drosophila elegans]
MKISLASICIVTLALLLCCFTVETEAKKCKAPLKWNAKLKKCVKGMGKPKKKPAGGTGATTAAAATTSAATTAAPA